MIDDELYLPRVGIHTREDLLLIRLHLLDDALMDPLLDFQIGSICIFFLLLRLEYMNLLVRPFLAPQARQ